MGHWLRCRRELRFPIITMLSRDSEIAPTGTLYHYFQSTLYIKIRKQVMLCVLGISNLNWITMGVLPL